MAKRAEKKKEPIETPDSIGKYLVGLARDLKNEKSIRSVLDDLEEALGEWREQYPEE